MPNAIIIGSGLGGLATALRLSKRGYNVHLVEQYHQAGGRLNQLKKDGFTFDLAPSFFSMSFEFQEFVNDAQIPMPFEFVELDPLYSVNFRDTKKTYKIYKNLDKLAGEFKTVEPNFRKNIEKYLASAGKFYHDTNELVIHKNFKNIAHYLLTLARVPMGHAPKMIRSFWDEVTRHFDSREVKEILSLVAFFLGATPLDTPALYSLLSYTELVHDGYHSVKGGMYKIVEGLVAEMKKQGIDITYHTSIETFEHKGDKVTAFIDQNGKKWSADLFVVNADAAVFRNKIMKKKSFRTEKLDKQKWTLAPFTMYLGIDKKLPELEHHSYFLGDNFEEYAEKIFKNNISLKKPYYYVTNVSKNNTEAAPENHEAVFILCPVPDLRFKTNWDDSEEIGNNILTDLGERIGVDLHAHVVSKTILPPPYWEKSFGLHRGSGLGLAHDLNQIGAFRPSNKDEDFKNVFYVGSSTVPGTGLPMAIISSKLVVERIEQTYGSLH
ncbi:MAG: phytoene desaturase family protein [Salinivirgaceae bacterium]|jgi:phytoene desaturase|nr:phytoene desaturase family protein [Salinivirgaceae bacterium]